MYIHIHTKTSKETNMFNKACSDVTYMFLNGVFYLITLRLTTATCSGQCLEFSHN